MIFCHDWSQSNNQWQHSGSPHPKKFRVQTSTGKFLILIFGIKTASSSFINFQRAKLSMQSITHLCCCNWRIFWRKNAMGRSPTGSCSCTAKPCLTRHLQPWRNWPTWASNVLITQPITHPILRIWPRQTTTCSLDWKNNWKVAIFCPTQRSLLLRRPGWTDNVLNFFWLTCKS